MSDKRTTIASSAVVPTGAAGGWSRRSVLKGAAAGAGVAASSGLITGFPLVWSQNIKDITLVHVGGSYSAIIDIAKKATEDLGFKIEMQTAPHDALLNRLLTQPNSLDIADTEYFFQYYMMQERHAPGDRPGEVQVVGQGRADLHQGRISGRQARSRRQGFCPTRCNTSRSPARQDFAKRPTKWATGVPTVYNADTLGIRPDKVERSRPGPSCSIPKFKGKTAIVSCPRSASWTPRWRSIHAATSSTATKAT